MQTAKYLSSVIKDNPTASISLTAFSILILVLRKIHYKLIVHPQNGGRKNSSNIPGYRHPNEKNLDSEDIQIQIEGNKKLRGWYIKHPKPTQIAIYFHQNAGNIGGRLYYVNSLIKNSNTNILLVAYRGFSDSDGNSKPTEAEIMNDAISIFKKGIQLSQKEKLPLFVFGRSLGGAASIHVLSRPQFKYSAKGLIIQNTFTSIYDVACNILPIYLYPLRILLWLVAGSSYRSIDKIKDIFIPILFIKGRRDSLVPAKLMDRLQSQFQRQKKSEKECLQVENGSHNDTWYVAGNSYFQKLNKFMSKCSSL